MAELWLLLKFGMIFKFQPNLELVVIGYDMPTRFKFAGLHFKTNPKKCGDQSLRQGSTFLSTCKGSNSFTLFHQNCKLELKLCGGNPISY